MGTIAFASAKSSPGVTTTIAALAATWPADRDLYVAELDPAGGDLAVRLDLAPEPGLVSLAAAGRRDLQVDTYLAHTQALPFAAADDVARRVLVAPVAADQSVAALGTLRSALAPVLARLGGDVLVDCGRLDPGSPVVDLVMAADLLVVVARPVVAEVHHLAARLAGLRPRALSLLAVGEAPYPVTEVATAVGATALGTLPGDARAAEALGAEGGGSARAMRRSRLLRDARAIAQGLAAWLGPAPDRVATPTGETAGPPPYVPYERPAAPGQYQQHDWYQQHDQYQQHDEYQQHEAWQPAVRPPAPPPPPPSRPPPPPAYAPPPDPSFAPPGPGGESRPAGESWGVESSFAPPPPGPAEPVPGPESWPVEPPAVPPPEVVSILAPLPAPTADSRPEPPPPRPGDAPWRVNGHGHDLGSPKHFRRSGGEDLR